MHVYYHFHQFPISERRCTYGKLTYEKTTGYELIRAQPYRLYSLREGGIVGNCGRRCESDTRCMGFNMDYNRNECQAVTKNSKNNLFNLRPSSGVSFFEAICLKGRFDTYQKHLEFGSNKRFHTLPLTCASSFEDTSLPWRSLENWAAVELWTPPNPGVARPPISSLNHFTYFLQVSEWV